VAVLCAHGPDLVEAILGVLAAGRVVVVIDPQAPTAVSATVLRHSRAATLLHDTGLADLADALLAEVSEAGAPVAPELLALDAVDAAAVPGPGTGPPPVAVRAADPAMLAYTSGSTGDPKAAVLSHRALLQVMKGATDTLAISPGDRLPMLFPVSLAVAAYPMFLPLVNGAALCTFDLRSAGLASFVDWLADQRITVIYLSPTVARFMERSDRRLEDLRLVVLGGERVDADAVRVVRDVFGEGALVANGYGTTETGVLTFFFTTPGESYPEEMVPVGYPVEGMDLSIVDGELSVRSRFLFDGYWQDAEATAAVLRPRADGTADYRTADLADLDDRGLLTLGGRADTELKVRGQRVVPSAVEQALLALAEVVDAVVEGRDDALGTTRLVAWVVPADGLGESPSSVVRAALEATVKPAMVPADIVVIDRLPMLPNGKLDRQALPDPTGRPADLGPAAPARTPLERDLVQIWRDVLWVDGIGVDDDFADLGGHSLDAARMLVVVEEQLGVAVPMADLLTVRTIAQLAEAVERHRARTGRLSTVVEVQRGDPSRPRLFFAHDLYGTAYVLRHLAVALGADQPLSGFESPLLRGPKSPFPDLETLAMRYVIDLRLAQPEGPYHLAGYSFGGVMAFEMARQLLEDGEAVAFLGVVDVGPGYRGKHYDPHKVLDKPWMGVTSPPDPALPVRDRIRYYRDMVRRDKVDAVHHLLLRSGLDRFTDPLQFGLDLRRTDRIHPGRRTAYSWRTHWQLGRRYPWDGRTYAGDMTLFWADATASADATMGWGAIVQGDLEIVRISVLHDEVMKEEAASQLGGPLRAALDRRLGLTPPTDESPPAA